MEAERRQVTVLFTDMVGFTTFSERAGEEAAFTLMQNLAKLMEDAVSEQGGVVQGFTGDGVMAVFGAPVALEDAPLRACRAALAIHRRLKAAGGDLGAKHGVRPQLRIGVNTGLAVVGQVQSGEGAGVTVLGDTVNVAARLQAMAEPDATVMSEAMHQLVEGMVEATFAGEHRFKGKSEPQKVYRLVSITAGATRFGAAVGRGLSAYVGRERELDVLERALVEAGSQRRVVDIVADPGMGKSRLLHEFRRRLGLEQTFILTGSCSSDGQKTPFLPFIEVVRGSFQVNAGEAESEVARKLEEGLNVLALNSLENLGLLLNLLGLKPPQGSLTGLDGVLIGLRTRDLLQTLLEARCRLSPVVLIIEDLHWADSVSREVLGKIVDGDAKLRLLILHTRRLEYGPPWLDRSKVTKLHLEALPTGDIRRLVQTRLGVEVLPEALVRLVTEKAEGNALFAEEIVSFLIERSGLRATGGKVEFDANAVAAALPASIHSLLTARVDRLAPQDRALLQAAAVIGRRFDPELLTAAAGDPGEKVARLAAMQALDLVYPEAKSGDYSFKHALVRDALYQSLLTGSRFALHLKIAEEIERRSGNRLAEVAETLAHHYSQTNRDDKAFAYLAMAAKKSLGVYSLGEAETYFTAALALVEKIPDCASDDQVAEFIASFTLLLNLNARWYVLVDVIERHLPRIDRLGDDPRVVFIRHHLVFALLYNTRYRDAITVQRETLQIAERLGDSRSMAYALAGEIHLSSITAPKPPAEFEILKKEAIRFSSNAEDSYIRHWTLYVIAVENFFRGRVNDVRSAAYELRQVGQQFNDPRCTGLGLAGLAWIALATDSVADALAYSEQSLALAIAPHDRMTAVGAKGTALVLLGRTEEGVIFLDEFRQICAVNGALFGSGLTDGVTGVAKILGGNVREGIQLIEDAIERNERDGYRTGADFGRGNLAEVYLQIIAGKEKPPLRILFKNLPVLLKALVTGPARIQTLIARLLDNPRFDREGIHIGRAQMTLGLLYTAKKKRTLAVQYLTEAKRIISQFGPTPMLMKIEAALAEVI